MIRLEPIIPKVVFPEKDFLKACDKELHGAATRMNVTLKTYPPYRYVSWASIGGFVSEKQAYTVIRKIRTGVIQIPHPRSGRLGASWQVVANHSPSQLAYIVGSYGYPRVEYVQSRPKQHSRMRIIGWTTVEDVAEKQWPKEAKGIQDALSKYKPPST